MQTLSFDNKRKEYLKTMEESKMNDLMTDNQPKIALEEVETIVSRFVEHVMETQFIFICQGLEPQWTPFITSIKESLQINSVFFQTIHQFEYFAMNQRPLKWRFIICSEINEIHQKRLRQFEFVVETFYIPNIWSKQFEVNLKLTITKQNKLRSLNKSYSTFVFLDQSKEFSNHFKNIQAMINYKQNHVNNKNIIEQLQKVYLALSKVSADYDCCPKQVNQFFSSLKLGVNIQDVLKWYTRKQVSIFRITNCFLRFSKTLSQILFIHPFFSPLFKAIEGLYYTKQGREKFVCYRGVKLTQEEYKKYKQNQNKIIFTTTFLSTSLNKQTAKTFGGRIFKIYVDESMLLEKIGYGYYNISQYSHYQEEEVLFNPLNQFLILKSYVCPDLEREVTQLQHGVFSKNLNSNSTAEQ